LAAVRRTRKAAPKAAKKKAAPKAELRTAVETA
jgi:hypothetical protein